MQAMRTTMIARIGRFVLPRCGAAHQVARSTMGKYHKRFLTNDSSSASKRQSDKFDIGVSITKSGSGGKQATRTDGNPTTTSDGAKPAAACGDVPEDDEMEQEEMFVEADECLGTKEREWGGPRRGGRMPEPTRYGDWERKGRCTDF